MQNGEEDISEKDFKDELVHKLNEFRKTNILCDTTIRTEGQDFAAHKCVLSAVSPHFRAMFTSQMKKTQNSLVELQEAKSTAVSEVLEFIYTGEAKIDSSNAQDIVMIADYLIIPSLKAKASLFLEGTVNASNCLALESFACQYNCESLKQVAVTFACENFVEVAKSEDFRMLDLEKVQELICKDEINVSEEEQVYKAVISWVKHDLPSRECLLPELLKCVRLFSMSEDNLRKVLDEDLVNKSPTCTTVVTNALELKVLPSCHQDKSPKPRLSLDKYVVLTGGRNVSEEPLKNETFCFVLSTRTWLSLPSMPCYSCESYSAVCNGKLYVLGFKDNSAPSMCCFDPDENKWSSCDLTLNLSDFSVTCLNNQLYIIGGENGDGDVYADVHVYNPAFDQWSKAASIQTSRSSHGAVVLDDHIYVIGGENGQGCLNSVECYNPLTDHWADVSSMFKPRMCAAVTSAYEKLIVVGGFVEFTEEVSTIEPSCEIFNLSTNEWSLVSGPHVPRAFSSAVSIDDVIYIFGGEDESDYLSAVECFDIKRNEWYQLEPMPYQLSCVQATLLKIPIKFIQNYSGISRESQLTE